MAEDVLEEFKRAANELSPREVARLSGISHPQVAGIIGGTVKKPRASTMRKIRAFLVKRKEAETNGRKTGSITPGEARAALDALDAVKKRIDELQEYWSARLDAAVKVDPTRIHGLAEHVASAQKPTPESQEGVEKKA